jgi:hypothetical protein
MVLFFQNMDEFNAFKRNTFSKEKIPIEEVQALMTQYDRIMEVLNNKLTSFFSNLQPMNIYMSQEAICEECWKEVPEQEGDINLSTPDLCFSAWILIVMNMILYHHIDNKTDQENGYEFSYYDGNNWICNQYEGLPNDI